MKETLPIGEAILVVPIGLVLLFVLILGVAVGGEENHAVAKLKKKEHQLKRKEKQLKSLEARLKIGH